MLARREALQSAGFLDERFFIYSEEPDLCLRIKRAGWKVCHLPAMTIVHHAGKAGDASQDVGAGRLHRDAARPKALRARPSRCVHRGAWDSATRLAHSRRYGIDPRSRAARLRPALRFECMIGLDGPPFGEPPRQAIPSHRRPSLR